MTKSGGVGVAVPVVVAAGDTVGDGASVGMRVGVSVGVLLGSAVAVGSGTGDDVGVGSGTMTRSQAEAMTPPIVAARTLRKFRRVIISVFSMTVAKFSHSQVFSKLNTGY